MSTVATLREAPFGVRTCNNFLARFHDIAQAIPTPQTQRQLAQIVGVQLPQPIATVAHDEKTLLGVAVLWTPIHLLQTAAVLQDVGTVQKLAQTTRALTFMGVDPDHRRQGIGRRLLTLLEENAYLSGAQTIFGFAEDLPDPSWPFYEQAGYAIHERDEVLFFDGIPSGQAPGRRGKLFRKELPRNERRPS